MRWDLIAAPLALFAAACGDGAVVIPVDQIVRFVPEEIDFGPQPVGEQAERTTRLESTGGEKLQIRDYRFDPETDRFLPRRESGGALRGAYLSPSDPIDLAIAFDPLVAGPMSTDMYVIFEGGEAKLPLKGEAYVVEPARAEVSPMSVLFTPATEIGRRVTQSLLVRNVGEKAGSVRVISAQAPFSVTEVGGGAVSSQALAPGDSRVLELAFTPLDVGMFTKTVKIALEDSTPVDINVSGEGVVAGTLNCAPMMDFGGVERGEIRDLALDCTVSGGAYTVRSISSDNPAFALIAGVPGAGSRITELHLTVRFTPSGNASTNGRPISGKLKIQAEHGTENMIDLDGKVLAPAPMGTDLKIVINWSAPGTDFDLHLVRDGHLPFETADDCYWDFSTHDWGIQNDPDDDPFLDKDARNGNGPEEINLGRGSGSYDVYVQYFGGDDPAPSVSVRFDYWLKGVQGAAQTKVMSVCGNTWKVGRLDFTTGTPQMILDGAEVNSWSGRATSCL